MSRVFALPAFNDNYIWVIESDNGCIAVVDPGDAKPVMEWLTKSGRTLTTILITHRHADHIGGVSTLLSAFPDIDIISPEHAAMPWATQQVKDQSHFELFGLSYSVIATPGHTQEHVCYFQSNDAHLFCGDTLFAAGCGRLFDGTAQQLYASLMRLIALPPHTKIYCAHEYTENNLQFAVWLEPDNAAVLAQQKKVAALRADKQISLPSVLETELQTNPFLRCDQPSVVKALSPHTSDSLHTPEATFVACRRLKDQF